MLSETDELLSSPGLQEERGGSPLVIFGGRHRHTFPAVVMADRDKGAHCSLRAVENLRAMLSETWLFPLGDRLVHPGCSGHLTFVLLALSYSVPLLPN